MKRRNEILVGLVTLVALALLATGTLWLVRGGLQRGYPLYARFEWGAGLKQGQQVLFSGVNVGYVDHVDLLPNGGLVVEMRVYKSQRVPTGTVATIAPNGLFGDVLIALRADAPTPTVLNPGDTIPSAPGSASLTDVLARFDSVGQNIVRLTSSLNRELFDERALAQARASVVSANRLFRTLDSVVAVQSAEFTRTQEEIRRLTHVIDSAAIDSTVRALRDAATGTTRLMNDLRTTNERMVAVLNKLDSGQGTAGQLLNDPALYAELRSLVRQADSLIADFKADPRKYIKFSIF